MFKKIRLRYIAVVLTILILCFQAVVFSNTPLETSIVLLSLATEDEVVKTDPFLELLDMGEYILVPLNYLSTYLEIEVTFDRERNQVEVRNSSGDKEVIVNLGKGTYQGHMEWSKEPPVMHEGDFYVTPMLLEYLTGVKIDWNSQYQELTITGEQFAKLKKKEETPFVKRPPLVEKEEIDESKAITGADFSLGSIQYRIIWEGRKDQWTGIESSGLDQSIYLHGRAGDWAVSVGEETNFDLIEGEQKTEISLIRAKYNEDNKLIILGDTEFNMPDTLGRNNLRGILFKFPEAQIGDLLAYTTVKGSAEKGDKVTLYVNGRKLREQSALEKESYEFTNVPLKIKKLNIIKVVIEKSSGEKQEIVKKIAASPRIMEAGRKENMAVAGYYRDQDDPEWEGLMAGARIGTALSSEATLNMEVLGRYEFDREKNVIIYGSDLGLAFRIGDDKVVTIDWLVGGEEDNIEHGGEATLLYCLEAGYVEAILFTIPPEVADGINRDYGKGIKGKAVQELTEEWSLVVKGDIYHSIIEQPETTTRQGEVTFIKENDYYNSTSITGRLKKEIEDNVTGEDYTTRNVEERAIELGLRRKWEGFIGDGKLILSSADIIRDYEEHDFLESAQLEGYFTKEITNHTFLTGESDINYSWLNDSFYGMDHESELELKWFASEDTEYSVYGVAAGRSNQYTDYLYKPLSTTYGVIGEHYINENTNIYLDLSRVNYSYDNDYYFSEYSMGVRHYFEENKGQFSVDIGYRSPFKERPEPQWSGELSLSRYLDSGMEIILQAQRLHGTIWDEEPEHVIRVGIDFSLGFAGDYVQGQRFQGSTHNSFVSGIVYLDQNGNGCYDEGEKLLPGIKMALDGRRTKTDESGTFRFDFVRPDVYKLGIDLNSLPADYNIVTDEMIIKVRENENMFHKFGLTMNGTIEGYVFLDQNKNGRMDEGERRVQWAGLSLDNGARKVYTNYDGSFYLENVSLGEHTLTLLAGSLPATMKPADEGIYKIKITEENLDIRDLQIPLVFELVEEEKN